MLPDKIILSSNEDPTYFEFWPIVSWAYKKMFPSVDICLAFVTRRTENDPVVTEARKHGTVVLFRPIDDVPEGHQAKVARFILASQQGQQTCYIDDIDLFPLSESFIVDKIDLYRSLDYCIDGFTGYNDCLLCVGAEVYGFTGTYPISQMTAKGYVWAEFINPFEYSYGELIRSWKDKAEFDDRENINIWPDMVGDRVDYYFSDERLLRRLLFHNPVPKLELPRGYTDYLEATIDRHTLNKQTGEWVYDREKLKNHGYVNAHCARPYSKYKDQFQPLVDYINQNYGNI